MFLQKKILTKQYSLDRTNGIEQKRQKKENLDFTEFIFFKDFISPRKNPKDSINGSTQEKRGKRET